MNTRRIITAASALTLAGGLAVMTTAAAAAPSAAPTDKLPTMDAAPITQDASGYQGKWKISGDTVEESYEMGGETVSYGPSGAHSEPRARELRR